MNRTPSAPSKNRLAHFLLIGGFTFFIYYVALLLTIDILRWPYVIAIFASYLLAVVFHFALNRHFTFQATKARIGMQLPRYALLAVFNYCLQVLIVYFGYDLLGLPFYLCTVLGIMATIVAGFLLMKHWVFSKRFIF
jgi:putative flippase GtrA